MRKHGPILLALILILLMLKAMEMRKQASASEKVTSCVKEGQSGR